MGAENLAYALTQVVHNFGAVGVVGGALFALATHAHGEHARRFAWLILAAWSAQIASGIAFGAVSLHYYGETPDLSRIAFAALLVKVATAAAGVLLAVLYLAQRRTWETGRERRVFGVLAAFGVTALTAAAFLRWFS